MPEPLEMVDMAELELQYESLIQKDIDAGFISEECEPLICKECLGFSFTNIPFAFDGGYLSEYQIVCADCGRPQGYWAHGNYQV